MKRVVVAVISLSVVVLLSQSAFAATSWRQGKKVFKNTCSSCHRSQKAGGKLKISAHNREFWSSCVKAPQDDAHRKVLQGLSEEEQGVLLEYFYKYANDGISKKKEKLGC